MAQFKFKRNWYSKKFSDVLLSKHRFLIVYGGRGSGKTRHIMLKLIANTFSSKFVNIYYCRKEFETIRKTTYRDICLFLKSIPELDQFFDYSTRPNGSMIFTNTLTGQKLIPFGLDDPENKTKGISEATHIWIDELDKCSYEQFSLINAVLRTPQAEYLQFIGSFNPVDERFWGRGLFFDPEDPYKPNNEFGSSLLINHSTVHDNEYIDVEEYIKQLTLVYAGNKTLIDVNIHGLWGDSENGNRWLYAFDKRHVVDDVQFMPTFPLYLSFDFNLDPVTCVAFQQSPTKGGKFAFINIVDSWAEQVQLPELCKMIKTKYPSAILFVTGDAAGHQSNVGYEARNQTYYTVIKRYLNISSAQLHTFKKNISYSDSRILCNTMFYNYSNIKVSKKNCGKLIDDCYLAKVDDSNMNPSQLKKDRGANKLDLFDCLRYFLQQYYLDYINKLFNLTIQTNERQPTSTDANRHISG